MSLNSEGEMLLAKVQQKYTIRQARDKDASDARQEQQLAEREFTEWKLKQHGIVKGSIIEWDQRHGPAIRARVESWSILTADSKRYNQDTGKYEQMLEDIDELPTLYVRVALKSGGWSARTHSIWDSKEITQVY
jgi:hypothetical protein